MTEIIWDDNISNPDNYEYLVETAFNNGEIPLNEVTQEMFNERYLNNNTPEQLHNIWMSKFGNIK